MSSMREHTDQRSAETYYAHAAFYAMYLLKIKGYSRAEAARLVIEAYPRTRPQIERFTRRAVVDPLVDPLVPMRQPEDQRP